MNSSITVCHGFTVWSAAALAVFCDGLGAGLRSQPANNGIDSASASSAAGWEMRIGISLGIKRPAYCRCHLGARKGALPLVNRGARSEEHTSELQSLMRISYAVFCLKKKIIKHRLINQP